MRRVREHAKLVTLLNDCTFTQPSTIIFLSGSNDHYTSANVESAGGTDEWVYVKMLYQKVTPNFLNFKYVNKYFVDSL